MAIFAQALEVLAELHNAFAKNLDKVSGADNLRRTPFFVIATWSMGTDSFAVAYQI